MQNRDLDGPTSNLALADIISNALPQECKKDKNDMNVSATSFEIYLVLIFFVSFKSFFFF